MSLSRLGLFIGGVTGGVFVQDRPLLVYLSTGETKDAVKKR